MNKLLGSLSLVLAFLALAPAASAQSIIPREGHYSGVDVRGYHIGFHYSRAHGMRNFTVDYRFPIGGAHVSNAMWHETFHNGFGTAGHWTHHGTVVGYYRQNITPDRYHWTVRWTHQ